MRIRAMLGARVGVLSAGSKLTSLGPCVAGAATWTSRTSKISADPPISNNSGHAAARSCGKREGSTREHVAEAYPCCYSIPSDRRCRNTRLRVARGAALAMQKWRSVGVGNGRREPSPRRTAG
jgi:hypothetical protein